MPYRRPRPSLQLRLDIPWYVRFAVLSQDVIRADSVLVFRVNEETVHVEEAGADRGRTSRGKDCVSAVSFASLCSVILWWAYDCEGAIIPVSGPLSQFLSIRLERDGGRMLQDGRTIGEALRHLNAGTGGGVEG